VRAICAGRLRQTWAPGKNCMSATPPALTPALHRRRCATAHHFCDVNESSQVTR